MVEFFVIVVKEEVNISVYKNVLKDDRIGDILCLCWENLLWFFVSI